MTHSKLPISLAPLQGYTEAAYRNAHQITFGGITEYYTPFVRYEKGGFRNKDVRDISPSHNSTSQLVPQLLASDLSKAESILALFIDNNYKRVDINLGCPFPMIAKKHNGSGILPYPDEVKDLLRVVTNHPEIEFSVKMRLGWENPDECIALAPILNDIQLKHITMHPRLGKQQYKGTVDLEGLKAFADICRHPLIYNGDIETIDDIDRIHRMFPQLAGMMIGRGLLANPALALEYKTDVILTEKEKIERVKQLHKAVYQQYEIQIEGGDAQLLNKMKTFWEYLTPLIGSKCAKRIKKANKIELYLSEINHIGLV